ncbi:MAG: helix-turn-helix domain-containing protein [Cyanobacteria bacterium P01_D01_bin.115]
MRPHSADLRQRIVTLYEQGEGSIRQLAQRFQVSPDSVLHKLAHRYRLQEIGYFARIRGALHPCC